MLLALFLIDAAAGLYLFLPLVGRRNAGVKFYRLILIVTGALVLCASVARWDPSNAILIGLTGIVYVTLRYPRRLIFRVAAALLGGAYLVIAVLLWRIAIVATWPWSIAGALSSIALLGTVNLAMLLGHWYLVVRGMSIDPLKRLTIATLAGVLLRTIVVASALVIPGMWTAVAIRQGIFFWMRAGWGLVGPLALYPMVWGTVKIRSTMAATGILYVDVVAVVIGEVLGGWLSAIAHVPV
ncbi:MAG: hypothetical protein M3041_04445 [Acidobacteriota bacterium]|nr:hypothetical protein [Acidobacteriota bacterium]